MFLFFLKALYKNMWKASQKELQKQPITSSLKKSPGTPLEPGIQLSRSLPSFLLPSAAPGKNIKKYQQKKRSQPVPALFFRTNAGVQPMFFRLRSNSRVFSRSQGTASSMWAERWTWPRCPRHASLRFYLRQHLIFDWISFCCFTLGQTW